MSCTPVVAEQVAAVLELGVEPLEHAQAELALALDGDDPGVGQLERGVDLELDPLLEVDQVELELVGAVAQGRVGDQGVEERRLARAGLAGDQDVLRRALAELEVLELGGAGAAERDVDAGAAVLGPVVLGLRGDEVERDLDAMGVAGALAVVVEHAGEGLGVGGGVERQGELRELAVAPDWNRPSLGDQFRFRQNGSRSLSWHPEGSCCLRSTEISV